MIIRPETDKDHQAIFDLTQAAFADQPHSDGTEGPIINQLRKDGDLVLSLVAETRLGLLGHIAFSPVQVGNETDGLFAIGPVSVRPEHQGVGIGKTLIEDGIARLNDAKAIFLVGDPAYYERFGFKGDCGLTYGDLPPAYVQTLSLDGQTRQGEIIYAPGFSAT